VYQNIVEFVTVADKLDELPVHIDKGEAVGDGFAGGAQTVITTPAQPDQQPLVRLYDLA